MKFFKQTKETKRKISFFMALAMVISLLPASPVVKAGSTKTASNDSKIYVNVEAEAGKYVKYVETVTGGATKGNEATTASVIVAPENGFDFENVEGQEEEFKGEPVSLGSISIKSKDGKVTTSASVVIREKTNGSGNATAVSPSNLSEGVIAKASLVATGPSIAGTSKNITGAVISVEGIASDNDIEVAIILDNGEKVNTAEKVNVRFSSTLKGAGFEAKVGKDTIITSSKSVEVDKDTEISLKIKAIDDKVFDTAPEVKVNEKAVKLNSTDKMVYTGTIVADKDVEVLISGEAKSKTPETGTFKVEYSDDNVENASVEVTLQSGGKFESGKTVKADDTLIIKISPDKDCYFKEGAYPEVKLETEGSATLTPETKLVENAYKVSVSKFKADTKIVISAKAEAAKVKDETNPKNNVGTATLDIASIQDVESGLKAAFSALTDAALKKEVEAAFRDNGTVAVSLSVTSAGITETEITKGKDAVASKSQDKEAKDRAKVLDISLTAICKDKNGNEIARVKVDELNKTVTISIKATGIFGNGFNGEPANGYERKYFVVRLHGDTVERIECKYEDGNITFESGMFSTYVFSYEDVKTATTTPATKEPGKNPPSVFGGGGSASTPTPSPSATPDASATPAPSASAVPSAEPGTSAEPGISAKPGTSASPSETAKPGTSSKPDVTKTPDVKIKVGKKVTVNSSKYKVTSVSGTRAVQFTSGKKNVKNIVIPATVKISGKNYKVTSIAKNAFKNNKKLKKVTIGANVNKIGKAAFKGCKNLKSIVIKTKKLTAKKVGANAFKGINKKATFKVPKNKVKAYKKIVKAKGAAKTVKVKK